MVVDLDAVIAESEGGTTSTLKEAQFDIWKDTAPLLFDKFGRGKDVTLKSYAATAMALDPMLSDEDELEALSNFRIDDSMDQSYKAAPWAIHALSDASEMLPQIGATTAAGMATGASFAAGQIPLAAGLSRVPVVGPAAAAAVEGGAFSAGFTVGSVSSITSQSFGEIYIKLRQDGVNRNTARAVATVFGAMNAGLDAGGFGVLKKLAGNTLKLGEREALRKVMTNPRFLEVRANAYARFASDYLKNLAVEPVTEGVQEFDQNVADMTAAYIETGKTEDWDGFWKKGLDGTADAFMTALGASLFLGAGTGAVSYAAGKVKGGLPELTPERIREATAALEGKSLSEIAKTMTEALEEVKIAENGEKIDFVRDETGGITLLRGKVEAEGEFSAASDLGLSDMQIAAGEGKYSPGTEAIPVSSEVSGPLFPAPEIVKELAPRAETQAALDDIFPETVVPEFVPIEQAIGGVISTENAALEPLTLVEIKARQNQIASDLRLLRSAERQLERDFTRREQQGRATANVLAKMEKVLTTKENLEFESELLDSGLVTRDDTAGLWGRQRMSTIANMIKRSAKTRESLTKQISKLQGRLKEQKLAGEQAVATEREKAAIRQAKAEERAFTKGETAERRAIRAIQNQLTQIVDASTRNSAHRKRLKSMIAKVTNDEQFNRATKQIESELRKLQAEETKHRTKHARDKILKSIDKMLAKGDVRHQSGKPVAKAGMDADTTTKLRRFKELMKSPEQAEQIINAFVDTYTQEMRSGDLSGIPDSAFEEYRIATMVDAMQNMDLFSLNIAEANLADWIQQGKELVAEKKAALKEQRENELQTALESIDAVDYEARQGKGTIAERSQQTIDSLGTQILTFDQLMEFISPKDKEHKIRDLMDPSQYDKAYYIATETQKLALMQALQGRVKMDVQQRIEADSHQEYDLFHINQRGEKQKIRWTKAQIMDIYMKMQDETLHEAMRDTEFGNGWTFAGEVENGFSTEEIVNDILTDEDKAIVDELFSFYDTYHGRVNDAYREKYGVDLPKRDNYSPLDRKGYDVDPTSTRYDDLQFSSMLPGAAQTRTKNLHRINPINVYEVAAQHIEGWENFITRDEYLGRVRYVFKNGKLRQALSDRHGADTLKVIDDYIQRFVMNDAMPADRAHPLVSAFRGDVARFGLGFKQLYQMGTQLTAGTAMWRNHNIAEIVNGAAMMALHPVETEKILRSSAVLKHRFREGATFDLQTAMKRQGLMGLVAQKLTGIEDQSLTPSQYHAITNIMYAGIRYGDAGVARFFGGPLYWAEIAKGKISEEALITVENEMTRTQQSDQVSQVPYIYGSNPILYTLVGQFTLQPLQLLGHSIIAARDLQNNFTPKGVGQWAHKTMALWMIPGLLFGMWKALPGLFQVPEEYEDEDEWRKRLYTALGEGVLGPIGALPLIGQAVESAWFVMMGYQFREDSTPAVEMMKNIFEAAEAWQKYFKDSDTLAEAVRRDYDNEVYEAWLKTGRAISQPFGIPATVTATPLTLKRALDKGDYLGAGYALGGWSPGRVKQRWREPLKAKIQYDEDQWSPTDWFNDGVADLEPKQPQTDWTQIFNSGLLNDTMEPSTPDESAEEQL